MALSSKTPAINMKNGAFDNLASIDPVSNLITHQLGTLHTAIASEAQACMARSVFFGWMAVVAVDAIGNDKSAGTFLHVINKATGLESDGLDSYWAEH
jgi:hypothetical protein